MLDSNRKLVVIPLKILVPFQVLDTQELEIKSIKRVDDDSELSYFVGEKVATFGNPLTINVSKVYFQNLSKS